MPDNYQDKILEKLSEHSILLATIAQEIQNLKFRDHSLGEDQDELMGKIDKLEERIRILENKIYFGGAIGFLLTLIGGAIAFLLK